MVFDHDTLHRHFGQIWPIHVTAFTDLIILLRKHFGGDLELMLVLAIIGSRSLPSDRIDGLSYHDFAEGRLHDKDPSPINVQSVAECSGIPRETVRRKVRTLRELGWLTRRPDGVLEIEKKAAKDLTPATEATMRYLVAVGSACARAAGED